MIALAYDPDALVTENLGLARHMVRKIMRWSVAVKRMGYDEALGHAHVALVQAAQQWGGSGWRGCFSTWACRRIQQYVLRTAHTIRHAPLGMQSLAFDDAHAPDESDAASDTEQREILLLAIEMLSDLDQEVIRAHAGIGQPAKTFKQMASGSGLTWQAFQHRHTQAMKRLRNVVAKLARDSLE